MTIKGVGPSRHERTRKRALKEGDKKKIMHNQAFEEGQKRKGEEPSLGPVYGLGYAVPFHVTVG